MHAVVSWPGGGCADAVPCSNFAAAARVLRREAETVIYGAFCPPRMAERLLSEFDALAAAGRPFEVEIDGVSLAVAA